MVPLTMSKSRERLSVSSMSAFSENKFVSSLKVDPLLRSYQVSIHIIIHKCMMFFIDPLPCVGCRVVERKSDEKSFCMKAHKLLWYNVCRFAAFFSG